MRCKNCHYSLESLPGPPHRCPECGGEFDPSDSNSFLTARQIAVDRFQRLLGVGGMALALLAILILATVTRKPFILVFMLPSLVVVAVLTWIHKAAKRRDREAQ